MNDSKIYPVILLLSAISLAQDLSNIPFVQQKVSDSFFIEHAANLFVQEVLDGPANEAMVRNVWSVDCDTAGNIYIYDATNCNIRAIRRSDKRMFTISGNGHVSFGGPLAEGPAHMLYLGSVATIELPRLTAVGNPLSGNGALYVWDPQGWVFVKLYRKMTEDGIWWYEHIAGGGSASVADGVSAKTVSLYNAKGQALLDGRVVVMKWGQFFTVEADGKLKAMVRQSLLDSINSTAGDRTSYGINGAGIFCISASSYLWFISPNGDSLLSKMTTSYSLSWGAYPDKVRNRWYVRGMDDYSINRVEQPNANRFTMMTTGLWQQTNEKNPSGAFGGERGMPMMDGRYATWSGHSGSPVFINYFLDEVGKNALIKEQERTTDSEKLTVVATTQNSMKLKASPNPYSSGSASIEFFLNDKSDITLQLFNINGKLMVTLVNGVVREGRHEISLGGRNFSQYPAGTYLCRLRNENNVSTMRIVKIM
jgi:hypothetical protein